MLHPLQQCKHPVPPGFLDCTSTNILARPQSLQVGLERTRVDQVGLHSSTLLHGRRHQRSLGPLGPVLLRQDPHLDPSQSDQQHILFDMKSLSEIHVLAVFLLEVILLDEPPLVALETEHFIPERICC